MKQTQDYDITAAFRKIENELIASMIRNMDRHRAEEDELGINWPQWQAVQLKSLERYKVRNQKKYQKQFENINGQIKSLIEIAHDTGNMEQEIEILEAIKNSFKGYKKMPKGLQAEFFRLNEKKLEVLIQATIEDMQKAETAILRMANDKYRKAIFNAQVYANTGAGTYEKAVDMATKDMLAAGLNCVEYANGARHTLPDYADMAIRTASKRAYLQGEGQKRQEWGISTVIMNKRGNPCPKCLPFCGKVLIDDVWSGGSEKDGPYPLMSYAVSKGLYHPRCKDGHTTYFPGVSTADDIWTKEELEAIEIKSKQEAERQYARRQASKYKRMASYSLDPDNKKEYRKKEKEWEKKAERFTLTDVMKEHRQDTPRRMVELVEKYSEDEFVIIDDTAKYCFAYNPDIDAVVINTEHPQYPYYDYKETMIHELAHRIDQYEIGSPMIRQFSDAIKNTERQMLESADRYKKMFAIGGRLEYDNLISDIVGCITDNVIAGRSSHDSQYIGVPGYTELEVFADIFSALYQGDNETVRFIKIELKELYQSFLKIIGE
ncbi:MAG: minor capsid protein [Lachnospiraceae bacterium]|nr:minor capsid protein [Lachnospiraceae bacterium]